jgi:hypothetical protein
MLQHCYINLRETDEEILPGCNAAMVLLYGRRYQSVLLQLEFHCLVCEWTLELEPTGNQLQIDRRLN